jgi:hypothetical protein
LVGAASRPRSGSAMKMDSPNIPQKGSKNLRTGRRSLPGQIYLLTTATFNREPFLQNPETAAIVLNSLVTFKRFGMVSIQRI